MKSLKIAALLLASTALAGCSLLYPHWGATTFPTDGPSSSSNYSPSAQPSVTASASPTPTVAPIQKATVNILQSSVDATAGVVDVVAQVTNVAESGGQCTLTVTSGSTSKTQTVRAESNVDTTQCFPMEIQTAGLASGTLLATVTYRSAGYIGSASVSLSK